jgi:hypothetical protein
MPLGPPPTEKVDVIGRCSKSECAIPICPGRPSFDLARSDTQTTLGVSTNLNLFGTPDKTQFCFISVLAALPYAGYERAECRIVWQWFSKSYINHIKS